MEIKMLDEVPDVPKKEHKVSAKQALDDLLASDKKAMQITCEDIKTAHSLANNMYQQTLRREARVKVWRKENVVYAAKEERDGD